MKKQIFIVSAVVISAGILVFQGCKKDDTTPPVITISGGNSQSQSLPATQGGGSWTNPPATAEDDEDGDLTSQITVSGTVDPNAKGTYTLTYSVSDAAGNTGTATLTVDIKNDAEYLAGSYAAKDSVYNPLPPSVTTYTETITASAAVNNRIWVTKFGNYQNGSVFIDRVSSTQITLSNQTVNCGNPPNNRTFSNTFPSGGTLSTSAPITMTLDYKETVLSPPSTAYAVETWVKQ